MWRRKWAEMSETEIPLGTIHGRAWACGAPLMPWCELWVAPRLRCASPTLPPATPTVSSGSTPPTSEDLQISPAVVRTIAPAADGSKRIEVTLSAKAVKPIAEQYGVNDVPTWLLTAEGVLFRGKLMHIDTVISDHLGGMDYLYHIMATE